MRETSAAGLGVAGLGAAGWVAGLGLAVGFGLSLSRRLGGLFTQPDAPAYLDLAAGRPVMAPFVWRQLGPLLVRGFAAGLHVTPERGFLIEGTLALAVFLGLTTLLLVRSGAPRWMLPALVGMFFWAGQFNGLVLPDLTFAALLAVLLWLLSGGRVLAATLMLFPLVLARESTVLVLVCLLLAGWKRLRRQEVVAALAATAAGMGAVHLLARGALPNREHLPGLVYLAAKVPGNLLRNVLGVELWADIYPACAVPRWQMALHVGSLHAVGVCRFGPEYPVHVLELGLASFGLLPLLLLALLPVRRSRGDSLLLRFCVLYGAVSFVAAPLLGFAVWRLFDYAWPLFLVALPLLLAAGGTSGGTAFSTKAAVVFVALHLLLSWSIWWIFFVAPGHWLGVEMAFYGLGWMCLRRGLKRGFEGAGEQGREPRID